MLEEDSPIIRSEPSIELMSVDELKERIAKLNEELRLCEAELLRKQSHLESVQGLFGD